MHGDPGGFEQELRTEVLDFNETVLKGGSWSDVDFVEELKRSGQNGGRLRTPAELCELRGYAGEVVGLKAEPEWGAGQESVELMRLERFRTMIVKP